MQAGCIVQECACAHVCLNKPFPAHLYYYQSSGGDLHRKEHCASCTRKKEDVHVAGLDFPSELGEVLVAW
jgi:hypothetical protein